MKTFWNVLSCIFASLLSIVLVVVLLVVSVYRSVVSFAQPKTLTQIVQNIDYTELLPSAEELKEATGVEWLKAETVEEFMQSGAGGKAIELYMDDVVGALLQTGEERKFTAEMLQDIVADEMDAVIEAIEPYISEETDLSKEELAIKIQQVVDDNAQNIIDALPIPEPTEDPAQDPFATIRPFLGPVITLVLIAAIIIIMAIIYACRFKRFGGMLWLGIDIAVAALPVTLLAVVLSGSTIDGLLGDLIPSLITLIDSATAILCRKLIVTAIVYFVAAAALIVGYILLRRASVKNGENPPAEALPQESI